MSLTPALVPRPRLDAVRDDLLGRRLGTVIAGPGFGKTTLLEAWTTGLPSALHAVTPDDRALATFGRSIFGALAGVTDPLPRDLLAALGTGGRAGSGETARAQAFAAAVCESLRECLTSDAVLVLDDVHHLAAHRPAMDLVKALCHHVVPPLHLVLASRDDLPFPLERFRRRGDLVELGPAELAFTQGETAALLDLAVGADAVPHAPRLHAATAGWPAAVRLAAEVLRGVPAAERASKVARLGAVGSRLAGYLLDEVVGREPLTVRELLRTVAPLPRFDAALCDALGQQHASETIASLVRRGLLVEPDPSAAGWFRVTDLARRFLHDHLPLYDWERADIQTRAATWFEAAGHHLDALRCLVSADDAATIAGFLRDHGAALLRSGATEALLDALEHVPAEMCDMTLDVLRGEALQGRGDWDAALASFERVAPTDGALPAGLAWRMGLIRHLRGELDAALAVYARGRLDDEPNADGALLLAWHAAAQWLRGEMEACADLADRALEVATVSGDDQALAGAHIARALTAAAAGDRAANDAHYARALEHAQRAGDVLQSIRVHTNRSSQHLEEARYAQALGEADRALTLTEVAGFAAFFRILALSNRGEILTRLGRLDEATADLEAARTLAQRTGSGMVAYPLGKLGDVYRIRGDRELARAAYEEALTRAGSTGDVQGLVPALAGLARLLAVDEVEAATELAARALEASSGLTQVEAQLAAAWVALARGDAAPAREHAAAAASTARARRDRAGLADSLHVMGEAYAPGEGAAALLEEAVALWEDIGSPLGEATARLALAALPGHGDTRAVAVRVEEVARALGARPLASAAATLAAGGQDSAPVAIRTLGGFAVLRDGEPAPRSAWQSRKARDLLKMMIARRGRMTARDVHMDALWPDADPSALSNRFSVALATVRSVLDPDKRFDSDHYVVAGDDAVGLDLTHLDVDVERFLADADAGLALSRSGRASEAIERLAEAEALYGGDFLEENPYEEWTTPLREEVRMRYLAVAHTLAEAAADAGDPQAAVRYLLRILERNPYDEAAHLSLVVNLQAAGHHGEARRSYRAYVARMEEIDVETVPMPDARTHVPT